MKSNLMKKTLGALALASLGLMAASAQAGWDHPGYGNPGFQQSEAFSQQVNTRQDRQMERIQHGMRTGELTRAEFHELMDQQYQIRVMERHFRADGVLDAHEFQRIDRALDLASRNIQVEKHDRQARQAYGHNPWLN
jgi:hypothetical protein